MHKHENDTKPQKAITLRGKEKTFVIINKSLSSISLGAKVVQYEDAKFGSSLELTWTRRNNNPKRYHVNNRNILRRKSSLSFHYLVIRRYCTRSSTMAYCYSNCYRKSRRQ
jgi:hypothetical protein